MKKVLIGLLLIILVLLGITEAFLPGYYEEQVESGVRREVEALDHFDVAITTHPALLLLFGQVQRGSVKAQGVRLEGLRIADLEAHYQNLSIAQTPQGVTAAAGTNTYLRAVFLEEDLNQYLQNRYSEFDHLYLDLTSEEITLNLEVVIFNTPVQLQLSGNFIIPNNHTIRFVLKGLDIAQISVPASLITRLLHEIEFDLELEDFPLPLDMREIRLENDRLIVLGGNS